MAEDNSGKQNIIPSSSGEKTITPSSDGNIATQAFDETKGSVTAGIDSITGLKGNVEAIASDPNMSVSDKAIAIGVAAVGAAQSVKGAIDAVSGFTTNLVNKAFVAVMGKLTFLKGIACLPIVKQLDPVLGLDVHVIMVPPAIPTPLPNPYIGIMFNPMDFLSCLGCSVMAKFTPPADGSPLSDALAMGHQFVTGMIKSFGASVKIGPFIPRVVATTPSLAIPHLPIPGPLAPAPPVKTIKGHAFLGSLFVYADNQPLSGGFLHLHNDCWDFGIPPIANVIQNAAKKLFRFPPPPPLPEPPSTPPRAGIIELYLPTGVMMPIPWNKPILVNPVPTPINPTEAINIFINAGFAKLRECAIGFLAKTKLGEMMGGCEFWTKVSEQYGTGTSHPADVSEGHFYTKSTDFSVSGIIPLKFKRIYHSYSEFNSSLGIGWNHCYEMALAFDPDTNQAGLRLDDGRTAAFEIPAKGKSSFNRNEKLWLTHSPEGYFHISDKKGYVYRFTDKAFRNPFNRSETHLLQSISNRNGYSIRFAYGRDGILTQITDTAGRIFSVENDGKGHISRIIAPSPDKPGETFVIASYQYDDRNRLIKQTDALGNSMLFEYEGSLLTKETWRNGTWWEIRYDKQGTDAKCLEITGPQDLFHHRLNYVAPDCTIVTNSLGNETTYYHYKGVVTKRIDPNGAETTFRYNSFNEMEWSSDPLGSTVTASYDEWGNLTNKTSADGGFLQIQYGNKQFPYLPTSAIDKTGGRWTWQYDEQGNLKKRINPLKAETSFNYTDGLLSTITGAMGQQTKLHYDNRNNLIEVLSPDEGRNRWRYDLLGRCMRYENAKSGITEYEYNSLGDAVRIKLPDGNIRELEYDEQGNIVHAKDKDRNVSFTYQGVNKLASRTERGATIRFLYNTEDQLRFVENEEGDRYEFKLNVQGEVVEEVGFDGLTRRYYRDLAGRVNSVERPGKKEIFYGYDEAGRVTKVRYENEEEETYEYRKDGLLTRAVNPYSDVRLERDILGRIVKETCNGESVESQYDIANNRTRITSSLGADIEAGYNLMGDVVSLSAEGWQTGYERDVFGLETARHFDGGLQTHTERDNRGRVISHQTEKNSRLLSEKSYLWGTNDKLLSVIADGKETRYEYDGWGNLSKTVFEDGKVEYRNPDKSGNLFESLDRMDRLYTRGGQLVKTKDWEYKYDAEGNLVRKKDKHGATWRYEWNVQGMLDKVKRPDGREVLFRYDALGRRIAKQFGMLVTRWIWDGNVPLHEQKSQYWRDYSEDKGEFLREEKHPLVTWVFEEGTFVPVAKLTEQQKFSIVTNYMGTPEAMYREDGEAVWKCELNSYGKVRKFQGEYKLDCPFRFQGQYEDYETGLYYNRFRYYDPDSGNYISQDPIRLYGGDNLYGYVLNPNGWVDIFGLKDKTDFNEWLNRGDNNYGNYQSPQYTGITNDYDRRAAEHAGSKGDIVQIAGTGELTKNQSRCIEQAIIAGRGGPVKEDGRNQINSINPDRDIYNDSVDWGNEWLKEHANDSDDNKKLAEELGLINPNADGC
jgi:RHS repeat-associated protein